MKNPFLKLSSRLGPNILDWLRTIYFSLLTTVLLLILQKWYSLGGLSRSVFIGGWFFILIGFIFSIKIANRFKNLEKDYEKDSTLDIGLARKCYYYKKEKSNGLQHVLFYTVIFIALILIAWAGFLVETKSATSSAETKSLLIKIEQKDSLANSLILTNKKQNRLISNYKDSLAQYESLTKNQAMGAEKLRDSLKIMKIKLRNALTSNTSR